MRSILTVFFILFFSSPTLAQSKYKLVKVKQKKSSLLLSTGYSKVNSPDSQNIFSLGAEGRYYFPSIALSLNMDKWFSQENQLKGNLNYSLSAGFVIPLTGDLSKSSQIYQRTISYKQVLAKKTIYKKKKQIITKKNNSNGIKMGLFISDYIMENPNNHAIGGGARLFYEGTISDSSFYNIGVRYHAAQSSSAKINVLQIYLSIGIFP